MSATAIVSVISAAVDLTAAMAVLMPQVTKILKAQQANGGKIPSEMWAEMARDDDMQRALQVAANLKTRQRDAATKAQRAGA